MKILCLALALGPILSAADVPDWLQQAATQTVPTYPAKVGRVVLLREEVLTVEPDGRRVMRHREAVKIVQRGAGAPVGRRDYNAKAGRIRDFQAWLLPPLGKPTIYNKNQIVDISAVSRDYVYDEYRAKVVDFGSPPAGTVVAWEVTEEEKTVFTQDSHAFQYGAPVLLSRFILNLPTSWAARGVVFNSEKVEPKVAGQSYTWELKDLPFVDEEDYSPALEFRVPILAVSMFPPAGNPQGLQPLKDWTAVSTWLSPMVDPAAEATDAIRTKSAQLTTGAANELAKIRAIASFAQQTNYVEILLNVAKGGGYVPHRADETLTKNYGDCKDKATLMRALLKAAGIDSYLTTIYSGERNFVRPEWPTPTQFNHAIIAVRVSAGTQGPTIVDAGALGRLLMFDPTDPFTPVGDLPESEQGSRALVIAGAQGALITMPRLPASSNRIESNVEAEIDSSGRLQARVARQYFGQSGAPLQVLVKLRGSSDLKKRLESTWTRRLAGVSLGEIKTATETEHNQLSLDLNLQADRFGQLMQGKLLVIHPGLLSSGGEFGFQSRQRTTPVEFDALMRKDSIRIKIPAGFKLDEMPRPAKLESPYGSIQASWKVEGSEVWFEQTLEIREFIAPVSEFAAVRDFFDQVNGILQAPVVLTNQ